MRLKPRKSQLSRKVPLHFPPLTIHVIHPSRMWSLNGLFRQRSSGCGMLVNPPGITAMFVLFWWSACFTGSARIPWNNSHTSKLFFLSRPPGHELQTILIQSFTPSASIQPLGWWWTTMPGGNLSFAWVFCLKMNISFNSVPLARQERTTAERDFLWPVVVIETVFSPRVVTVLADGMSNQTGV